ncbi:uncharacterized protein LAJ45_08691 [Morchella importuna]|uniref:uncharacterized protein n=1 Tax=Morchella importuna TaxID=1174673 RepID=UPI001E8D7D51|nr:uncharacterized protein LAJ45_08691 [Morchella importuna]KAH8147213.1 hypothetical protein LAJ45_08691 [Morchella importuna]
MSPKKRTLDLDRVVSDIDPKPAPKRRSRNTTSTTTGTSTSASTSTRITIDPHRHSLSALPYHVLTNILSQLPPTTSPAFLLTCATLCRALHDPAIATLYSSPLTSPPARAHKLLATLRARPSLGVKIRTLSIEVEPLLTTKLSGVPWYLAEFLQLSAGLRHLRFIHSADHPTRWRYPDTLWAALEASNSTTRLHTWRWDRSLIPKSLDYADLRAITIRCFTALRALEIQGFGGDSDEDEDDEDAQHMIDILALMPRITDIDLTNCYIVNTHFLNLLSTTTARFHDLQFTACINLSGDDLGALLASPACQNLRSLSVQKCNYCSLTFTSSLPAGLLHFAFDGQGAETELLPSTSTPVWPDSLQTLQATSLRRWSSGECERFLESVVRAVPQMRALRTVRVWCMLTDIDWRERSAFREKWLAEVRGVFGGAEVRFDNARPAETLWGEEDFVEKILGAGRRGGGAVRGRGVAVSGRGAARGGARGRGRARGRARNTVVVVKEVVSEGDEDYVDD